MKADMSFLGLNRPEYIPLPELALSELVWSVFPSELRAAAKELSPRGLAFGANIDTAV